MEKPAPSGRGRGSAAAAAASAGDEAAREPSKFADPVDEIKGRAGQRSKSCDPVTDNSDQLLPGGNSVRSVA